MNVGSVFIERALDADAHIAGDALGLDVDVVQDLQVVGDEADRPDHQAAHAFGGKAADLDQDVGSEPRLVGAAGALEREVVVIDAQLACDQARPSRPARSGTGRRRRGRAPADCGR